MKFPVTPLICLAVALFAMGGTAQADYATYDEAVDAAKVQLQKGDYAALEKTAEAEVAFAKTPRQKADALLGLGLSYSQRQMYLQAREQWAKIIGAAESPADSQFTAHSLMGASYGEENDWSRARAEFQTAVAMPVATTAQKASLGVTIAATFFNEKNTVEGRKQLSAIVEDPAVAPNFRALVYSQLGQELINEGEFEEARVAFNQALGFPTAPGELRIAVLAGIAQSYKAQGDETQAQAAFTKAQAEALKQMALLAQAEHYEAARAVAEQIPTFGTIAPTLDAVLQTQIGDFLWREGKPDEAIDRLEAFVKKQDAPDLPVDQAATLLLLRQSTQLKIATIYVKQGNKEKAKSVLQSLLATDNINSAVKNLATKQLQELG